MARGTRGFTLIELMIVITIIAIIMGIALPSLLGAKKNANESAAISALRLINTACNQYNVSVIPRGFPANLQALTVAGGGPADFIDNILATGSKESYVFNLIGGNMNAAGAFTTYQAWAAPLNASCGNRAFFVNESGVIRQIAGLGPAGPADQPIE